MLFLEKKGKMFKIEKKNIQEKIFKEKYIKKRKMPGYTHYSKTIVETTIENTRKSITVILAGKITCQEMGFKFAKRAILFADNDKIYCKMPIQGSYEYYNEKLEKQSLPQDNRNLLFDAIMKSCTIQIAPDYEFELTGSLEVSEKEIDEIDNIVFP